MPHDKNISLPNVTYFLNKDDIYLRFLWSSLSKNAFHEVLDRKVLEDVKIT